MSSQGNGRMDGFSGGYGGAHPLSMGEHPQKISTPPEMLTPPKIRPKRVRIPKKFACGGLTHDLFNK